MKDISLLKYIWNKQTIKNKILAIFSLVAIIMLWIFLSNIFTFTTIVSSVIISYYIDKMKDLINEWKKAKERVGSKEFGEPITNKTEIIKKEIEFLKEKNRELENRLNEILQKEPQIYKVEIKEII